MRLYLAKNPNKDKPKQPYFWLKIINEGSEDWETVAAFWKAKNGEGYSGQTSEGYTIKGTYGEVRRKVSTPPDPNEPEPEFPETEVIED